MISVFIRNHRFLQSRELVYVMEDTNNDGLPNDGEWIEIKGSVVQ